jgi:iron complex outermembrane recepter protein
MAQRTAENAVTQASDAFGSSVGSERTGLYNSDDVRGFSPVDAGNVRIEGFYADQLGMIPGRLLDGNTIRVGITAQGYPFPAPTGLVDYRLTKPAGPLAANFEVEGTSRGGFNSALEVNIPLDGERLGLAGGFGYRQFARPEGGTSWFAGYGAVLGWHPQPGAEVLAFAGGYRGRGERARATLFPAGTELPPQIARREFYGQDWTERQIDVRNYGGLVRWPLGQWRVEAGLFQMERVVPTTYADLLTGVTPDGRAAARTIVVDGNNRDTSLSGEARVVREWRGKDLAHRLTFSLRGRGRDREFGGAVPVSLGASFVDRADPRAEPIVTLGAENFDTTRQYTLGAAYSLQWAGRGSLDLGLATSRYKKVVDFAATGVPTVESRDRPILWNVSGSAILSPSLALYGGYVAGQEEALIAPDIATNRAEAPPAIRTHQFDGGLRYRFTPNLTLVAGVFSITKPYFNLDPARRYRQLGTITNRGIELSLAGKLAPGLSLLAGTILLDPRIAGEAVSSGLIGERPVGQLRRRSLLNFDWRLDSGRSPWSFDLALESLSGRTANAANTLSAPAQETVNLGLRYRFDLGKTVALLRFQVQNVLDDYGWSVSSSGGFTYSNPRTAELQLVLDF